MSTCEPYEGCRGTGALADLTDSGSGWEVYCSCDAGKELQRQDGAFRPVREDRADAFEAKCDRLDGAK